MKKIAVLGSTGSIGTNALRVIESNPDKYRLVALAAGRNIDLLLQQIEKFQPEAVAMIDGDLAERLKSQLDNTGPAVYYGEDGFIRLATMDRVDIVISAMTGAAGLIPTYSAIEAGKDIALANKETIVMAGPLVMAQARDRGVSIIPIDSEHSAILQSLQGHPREDLNRIILTASGGPFKAWTLEEMEGVTPEQALKHPNWEMGKKISIDSATLMNKGLEIIEAKWLFDLSPGQIDIVIHPQSIIHSMVEYRDGSIMAQMGIPDMIIPISYALSFPRHLPTPLPQLRLDEIGMLSFEKPDLIKFSSLALAYRALETGDSLPAVMNGANEIAVESFLKGRIGFLQIPELIEETMDAHHPFPLETIEKVIEADGWARDRARGILERRQY